MAWLEQVHFHSETVKTERMFNVSDREQKKGEI